MHADLAKVRAEPWFEKRSGRIGQATAAPVHGVDIGCQGGRHSGRWRLRTCLLNLLFFHIFTVRNWRKCGLSMDHLLRLALVLPFFSCTFGAEPLYGMTG
jgi:hypothetical protein